MRHLTKRDALLLTATALAAVIAIPVIAIQLSILFLPQPRHLWQVRRHISAIQPQWETFKAEHPGYEQVTFFDYTGGEGMFGVAGAVPSDLHLSRLKEFIEGTSPPRPIFMSAQVVADDAESEHVKTPAPPPGR